MLCATAEGIFLKALFTPSLRHPGAGRLLQAWWFLLRQEVCELRYPLLCFDDQFEHHRHVAHLSSSLFPFPRRSSNYGRGPRQDIHQRRRYHGRVRCSLLPLRYRLLDSLRPRKLGIDHVWTGVGQDHSTSFRFFLIHDEPTLTPFCSHSAWHRL